MLSSAHQIPVQLKFRTNHGVSEKRHLLRYRNRNNRTTEREGERVRDVGPNMLITGKSEYLVWNRPELSIHGESGRIDIPVVLLLLFVGFV